MRLRRGTRALPRGRRCPFNVRGPISRAVVHFDRAHRRDLVFFLYSCPYRARQTNPGERYRSKWKPRARLSSIRSFISRVVYFNRGQCTFYCKTELILELLDLNVSHLGTMDCLENRLFVSAGNPTLWLKKDRRDSERLP